MKKLKNKILLALVFPIIMLILLACYKAYVLSIGQEIVLPITGYDPRSFLSGHYLTYTIDYGVKVCQPIYRHRPQGYVCLEPKKFSYKRPRNCKLMIKGFCKGPRFTAGIERYYVPEGKAKTLEKQVQSGQASILLSIFKNGKAQVKDLLIQD